MNELELIKKRYEKRNQARTYNKYDPLLPYIYMSRQEKERVFHSLFRKARITSLSDKTILEIGCGRGDKIFDLIQMGFDPKNIAGNELMSDNLTLARERLPAVIRLYNGDARGVPIGEESIDFVYQSMVFSSILDDDFQNQLAQSMWRWVKPGGGVLWYDFTYSNPNNNDVRGVSISRVKELFPDGKITAKRVTLAPPISRRVTRIHPSLYTLFNLLSFLRTHVVCYIHKLD